MNGRPGDERGFIHKKIFGGIKGAVGSVVSGITRGHLPTPASFLRGGIGGFFGARGRPGAMPPSILISTPRPTPPRASVARITPRSQAQKQFGLVSKFPELSDVISTGRRILGFDNGNGGNLPAVVCDDPSLEPNAQGFCEFPGSPAGGVGEALMGRYGAALEPMFQTINKRVCIDGMVLGKDKLCYNKGSISNKERLWPKGAAPLLTGGEMSAIRKASSAAGKFNRAGKRLAAVGKAFGGATRRSLPRGRGHAHAKPVAAVSVT